MTKAKQVFWHIRRTLGFMDHESCPEVDAAIKQELELNSIDRGEISIDRIKDRLGFGR